MIPTKPSAGPHNKWRLFLIMSRIICKNGRFIYWRIEIRISRLFRVNFELGCVSNVKNEETFYFILIFIVIFYDVSKCIWKCVVCFNLSALGITFNKRVQTCWGPECQWGAANSNSCLLRSPPLGISSILFLQHLR